jgi:hypothetical protein
MSIIFQTGHELSIVLGNESTSALAGVRFASTIEWVKPIWKIVSYNTTSSQRLSNIFVVVSRMVIRFMNTMSA